MTIFSNVKLGVLRQHQNTKTNLKNKNIEQNRFKKPSKLQKFQRNISRRRFQSYRNQFIGFQCKPIDWFLYHRHLRHERVIILTWSDEGKINGVPQINKNYRKKELLQKKMKILDKVT